MYKDTPPFKDIISWIRVRSLVISNLRSVSGLSLAASYVQRWALCSKRPAIV